MICNSFSISKVGKAEAERMRIKANVYKQYGEAAIMNIVLEALPRVWSLEVLTFMQSRFRDDVSDDTFSDYKISCSFLVLSTDCCWSLCATCQDRWDRSHQRQWQHHCRRRTTRWPNSASDGRFDRRWRFESLFEASRSQGHSASIGEIRTFGEMRMSKQPTATPQPTNNLS